MGQTILYSIPSRGKSLFSYSECPILTVGPTQPTAKWVQDFSLEVQQPGHVADHSPPYIAKVNLHKVIQLPPYVSGCAWGFYLYLQCEVTEYSKSLSVV